MSKRSYIVRFVDVVLILLFGFISISNTKNTSIELAESKEARLLPMDTVEIRYIGVQSDGTFLVDRESILMESVNDVRSYLFEEKRLAGSTSLKVRIRSSKDAPVKQTLAITELCEELGITSVLEVEVTSRN